MKTKKKRPRKLDPRLQKVIDERRRRRFAAVIDEPVVGLKAAGRAVMELLSKQDSAKMA